MPHLSTVGAAPTDEPGEARFAGEARTASAALELPPASVVQLKSEALSKLRHHVGVAAVLTLLPACGNDMASTADQSRDAWITEDDLRIGTGVGEDLSGGFAPVSDVRILADGTRILVAEAAVSRATIWTPSGSFIKEVGGHGEGPGQFTGMFFVQPHPHGFHVRDARRFTSFSADGTFIETIRFPPLSLSFRGFGLTPEALLPDRSVLAIPAVPAEIMVGAKGDDPIHSLPVLRLSERGERWTLDPVATLNSRNRSLIIGESVLPVSIPMQQFYGDYDLTYFDPVTASVVVVGRATGDGTLELVEVKADGDTVWQRRLTLPTVEPTPESTTHLTDALANVALSGTGGTVDANLRRRVQDQVKKALYVPNPLPGAWVVRGAASGEIWLRTFEDIDTLVTWYTVRRSQDAHQVRRVLLPRNFHVKDASDTHVWGVWKDELGVDHVLGRRLVRAPDPTREASYGGAIGEESGITRMNQRTGDPLSGVPGNELGTSDGPGHSPVGPSGPVRGDPYRDADGADAWTTRVDYRIKDFQDEGDGFDRFTRLRVGARGTRIVTTDGVRSGRVRVGAADGTLLQSMGHAELRGSVLRVWADAHSFWVNDPATGRTTGYGFDGKEATDTFDAPAGHEAFTPTSQGGFFGLGSLPHWEDFALDPSSRRQTVVHATSANGGVQVDTVALIDLGHANWNIGLGDRASPNPSDFSIVSVTQPFADHDLTWFDTKTGSVGVVRRSGPPGEAEVFRVVATGDTTWHRRLSLPAIPVSDEDAKQAVEDNFERFRRVAEDNGYDLATAEVRHIAETAVHVPSHLPAATRVVATTSGEVWLKTGGVEGELAVWYSLRLDERDSPPRRVLIPSSFRLMDAFEDHVWGLSNQSQGSWIVQGLRLLPPRS